MTSKWPDPITPEHRAQLEHEIAEMIFSCDNPVEEAITYYAGPRCDDYEPECASCKTWRAYDDLMSEVRTFREVVVLVSGDAR